jgi:hypothetical protein
MAGSVRVRPVWALQVHSQSEHQPVRAVLCRLAVAPLFGSVSVAPLLL